MADQPKQQLLVSDKEIATIKSAFANNEPLLKAMRGLFYGLVVTPDALEMVRKTFTSDEVKTAVRKRFLPYLSNDPAIGQVADAWLGTEDEIRGMPPDTIYQAIMSRDLRIKMVEKALGLLIDPTGEPIDLAFVPTNIASLSPDTGIRLLARNQYIKHMETQLMYLMVIAGQSDESLEQAKKRMTKDSTE